MATTIPSPDHGGNLAEAMARFGGAPGDWLDLSTGINPVPWPVGAISAEAWTRLPGAEAENRLIAAARRCYGVADGVAVLPAPGASALIPALPRLLPTGRVAIPGPTYNEHARAFAAEGWAVDPIPSEGTRAAVIVNPNNPDGRCWTSEELLVLAEALELLVVDESFMDPTPGAALRVAHPRVIVLRSFGKFYGLAGLRLGFALGAPDLIARLGEMLGPWAVSGPALEIGLQALADDVWAGETRARLRADITRMHRLGAAQGWRLVGCTDLFATFETPDAGMAQARLAEARIWSRIFPYSSTWLRLGLPADWVRLEALG